VQAALIFTFLSLVPLPPLQTLLSPLTPIDAHQTDAHQ